MNHCGAFQTYFGKTGFFQPLNFQQQILNNEVHEYISTEMGMRLDAQLFEYPRACLGCGRLAAPMDVQRARAAPEGALNAFKGCR